jgi:hypothetical protein
MTLTTLLREISKKEVVGPQGSEGKFSKGLELLIKEK